MNARPHEIANQMRRDRLSQQRDRILGACIIAAFAALWLGLAIGGGDMLRWAFPR